MRLSKEFALVIEGVLKLHFLHRDGKWESEEADVVRGESDDAWEDLTQDEQERIASLGLLLNHVKETLHTEG